MSKYGVYTLTITTPPASAPVSLSEFKNAQKINTGDDDTTEQIFLDAATECLTEWTGYVPVATVYTLEVNDPFRCGKLSGCFCLVLDLPRWPVVSVSSVQTRNTDGTWSTVSSTYYRLVGDRQLWVDRSSVPYTSTYPPGLKVAFTASGATTAKVKAAVLALAGQHYRNREVSTDLRLSDVPFACRAILESLRGGDY